MRLGAHHQLKLQRSFSTGTVIEREMLKTDLLIVGAGPAGLAAAIRLKTLQPETNITVLEKGPYVGAHILSGAVLDPRALQELDLLDDLKTTKLLTLVSKDEFWLLDGSGRTRAPFIPEVMRNEGNYVASLSRVTAWLGEKAQSLGVDVFSGFAASKLLYKENGAVDGIVTNDLGVRKNGEPGPNYQPGMEIRAPITLLAEGCHGHLSKQVIQKFKLREPPSHQTYGIGLKEVWQVPKGVIEPGVVLHTLGWPMSRDTYGGGFLYSFSNPENAELVNVSLGLVVGLDYRNPYLNPYQEFQRFKTHPKIKEMFYQPGASQVVAYGARALNEGGWQSLPQLNFPGGALLGCAAGMVNVPRVKGSHNAMKSGMIAAECIAETGSLDSYDQRVRSSWIGEELHQVRNVRPSFFYFGFYGGLLHSALSVLSKGREPWTLNHGLPDHCLDPASQHKPIEYPKPDGQLTFDLLTSVSRTGTMHAEDQPSHLKLQDPQVQTKTNYSIYAGPEQRFCPAGVYEYHVISSNSANSNSTTDGVNNTNDGVKFQINAQNCIHCKTCDIKDPSQNIDWTTPEGGGGPKYTVT